MSRATQKLVVALPALSVALVVGGVTAMEMRSMRTFSASYPAIAASSDAAIVTRGRELVYGAVRGLFTPPR